MNDSYNGNLNVKRDGITHSFSNNELSEYIKCMENPAYFAITYCKIISLDKGLVPFELYPYQEKMFAHFSDNRFSVVLACRRSGKSMSSVAYLLWFAIFNPEKTIAVLANKGATARLLREPLRVHRRAQPADVSRHAARVGLSLLADPHKGALTDHRRPPGASVDASLRRAQFAAAVARGGRCRCRRRAACHPRPPRPSLGDTSDVGRVAIAQARLKARLILHAHVLLRVTGAGPSSRPFALP